eukprot:CAMPEP_0116921388 /NCGR_PEP_ID=MMETSP0467-20121206/21597_1 /TAXON_ID=283647 /ORGANISM="Mesodinium pulex, Strain SPMC105" /LENGTH=112 /DNA_ID=CAMNT_0004599439 /DNA_START=437 /DNA_END=775 /DNA_ORIENTATION=+
MVVGGLDAAGASAVAAVLETVELPGEFALGVVLFKLLVLLDQPQVVEVATQVPNRTPDFLLGFQLAVQLDSIGEFECSGFMRARIRQTRAIVSILFTFGATLLVIGWTQKHF